jgi:hypothetical protein
VATREVYANHRWTVELDEDKALIRATRSDVPTTSIAEMERINSEMGAILDSLRRSRHVLLVDLRRSPVRNDPEYEQVSSQIRPKLFNGFPRIAVLVKTAVGALQVKRYAKEDRVDLQTFFDEEEALAYLEGRAPIRER